MSDSTIKTSFDPAINLARQSLYRFASLALADPRCGNHARLMQLGNSRLLTDAADLLRNEPAAAAGELAQGEQPLSALDARRVLMRLPETPQQLEECYLRTFGLVVNAACPPYETEYIDAKLAFQRCNALADVAGFYQAFGLQPSSHLPERVDHIVLELEFMACLLGLERHAAEHGEEEADERIELCRRAQTRFMREHLAWWVPKFAWLLTQEDADGFYGAVGNFLAALIHAERALLGVRPTRQWAEPSLVERPEECDGCLLAQG